MTIEYVDRLKFKWQVGTENSVVIGAHFQGKTYLAANLIARSILGIYNIWAWDHHGKIYNELLKLNLTPQQRRALGNRLRHITPKSGATCFIHPENKDAGIFDNFCSLVRHQYNLHVIFDELHNYNSAHRIPPSLATVIRDLGNQNVSYTAIFQRPAENHKSVVSNAKHRFMFALDVPTDIDYMRRWIGKEAELFLAPEERKYLKDEPQLPPRSFIYRNQELLRPIVVRGGLK